MNIIDTSAAAIKPNNAAAVSFSREIARVDRKMCCPTDWNPGLTRLHSCE
jgi:hypothetical protein